MSFLALPSDWLRMAHTCLAVNFRAQFEARRRTWLPASMRRANVFGATFRPIHGWKTYGVGRYDRIRERICFERYKGDTGPSFNRWGRWVLRIDNSRTIRRMWRGIDPTLWFVLSQAYRGWAIGWDGALSVDPPEATEPLELAAAKKRALPHV